MNEDLRIRCKCGLEAELVYGNSSHVQTVTHCPGCVTAYQIPLEPRCIGVNWFNPEFAPKNINIPKPKAKNHQP